jgi:chromosome partitioning protein
VVAVANQKGGVGKTTTTVNLAAALVSHGWRVAVLDLDPQANATTALGIDPRVPRASTYDVVLDGTPLQDVLVPSVEGMATGAPHGGQLWCLPATLDLAGAEVELVSASAREQRLATALRTVLAQGSPALDVVLVDTPPSLGLLTLLGLVAADGVLIPVQSEYYALEGLSALLHTLSLVRASLNPPLDIAAVLLTMVDGRTRLSADVAAEVRRHFPDTVLRTTIPRSVRVSEAPSHGRSVLTHDPTSAGAIAYHAAAEELATRLTQRQASTRVTDLRRPA